MNGDRLQIDISNIVICWVYLIHLFPVTVDDDGYSQGLIQYSDINCLPVASLVIGQTQVVCCTDCY